MLLPASIKKIQIRFARFGVASNTFPISWNPKQRRFHVHSRHYYRCMFTNFLLFLSVLYTGYRLMQNHYKQFKISYLELFKLWMIFFSNFNGLILSVHFVNHAETIARLGNDCVRLEKQIEDCFVDAWNPKCFKSVELVLKCFNYMNFLLPISQIIDFLINPWSFAHPTSFLKGITSYWVTVSLYIYIQGTLAFAAVFSCSLTMAIAVPMSSFVNEVIQELKLSSRNKKYRTFSEMRRPENLSHYYKSLFLLYELVNDSSKSLLMPMYSTHSYVVIWMVYVLIKQRRHLDISSSLTMTLLVYGIISGWIVILHMSGLTFKKSSGCLVSWKRNNVLQAHDLRILRKISSSCKPIGLKFGSYYIVRLVRVLKYVHFLIWGIVRALVIF